MRLSEHKIKTAILDKDLEVRQRAVRYFSKSGSTDRSLMPLVIEAVETFGRQDAYSLVGLSRDLPQTEETIAWIIDELSNAESDQHENYTYNLSNVLTKTDPALLLLREADILASLRHFPTVRERISERLGMLSWDEATCWKKLEDFCEEGKDKQYANQVNLTYGRSIVEALARFGNKCEDKVHAILSQKVDDFQNNPMKWMEPLVVRLAGEARLESTIPLLIARLFEDDEFMCEEIGFALTQIRTASVLEAVAEAYTNAPRCFRLYATEPLEDIHSDLAVEKCLHLLPKEKDPRTQYEIVRALLSQFSYEGIVEARKFLAGRKPDRDGRDLRSYLVETCTLMGERFPEYDEWLATEKAEKAEHRRRINELKDDPNGLLLYAFQKMVGDKVTNIAKPAMPVSSTSGRSLTQQTTRQKKVGKNSPCPCGSGKNFKSCCLKRQGG